MNLTNNLFYHTAYASVVAETKKRPNTVEVRDSRGFIFRRNTIDHSGAGQAVRLYCDKTVTVDPWVAEYNYVTACGLQQTDGAAFYSHEENATESVGRFNWFFDNRARDFRWDGQNNLNQDGTIDGVHANLYRTVAMAGDDKDNVLYRLKGDLHEIYNNIGIGPGFALNVSLGKGGNANTLTRNNAADYITDDPIPGTASNNFIGQHETKSMHDLLRDPDNFDFRPRADATELIDQGTPVTCSVNGQNIDVTAGYNGAAPDLGAYEYGDTVYWIAGRILPQASMPVPPSGNWSVKLDAEIMWLQGLDAISHDVYFGASPDDLQFLVNKPDPNNIVDPNDYGFELVDGTTYYWRVDTVPAEGSVVTGNLWSFTADVPDVAYWRFENNLLDSGPHSFVLSASGSASLAPLPASGAGSSIPATVPLTGETNTYLGDLVDANSYYKHPDDSWFDFGTNNITLEAFITAGTDGTSGQTVIEKAGSLIFQISTDDDELQLSLSTGSYVHATWSPPGGFETGKDYYIAATVEPGALNGGSDTRVNLYCKNLTDDTPPEGSGALTIAGVSNFLDSSKSLYVGGRGVPARKAVANIDEVRISRRVLAGSQLLYPITISMD
jgi:hypothetical protein